MPETRTELIRYPGVLTDWNGVYLNKKIKQQIRIGNCVRVLFANKEIQNNKHNAYTVYLTIIKMVLNCALVLYIANISL